MAHYLKGHKKEGKWAHLPRSKDGHYVCLVPNCKADIQNNQKKLAKHLKDEAAHSITELLDIGVNAWYYSKSTPENARKLVEWLKKKDLIDVKNSPTTCADLRKRE